MAEKIKDAEDRFLESLFAADAVADNGFSRKVMRRVRRRLWLRRLTLPCAAILGGFIAYRPVAELLHSLSGLVSLVPVESVEAVSGAMPQMQLLLMGGLLLIVGLVSSQLLQD